MGSPRGAMMISSKGVWGVGGRVPKGFGVWGGGFQRGLGCGGEGSKGVWGVGGRVPKGFGVWGGGHIEETRVHVEGPYPVSLSCTGTVDRAGRLPAQEALGF